MAQRRDSRGRFAGSGGGGKRIGRSNPLGEGSVKGTIAAKPGTRARRLQSGKGGSGFGENRADTMPRRVSRARDAVTERKTPANRAAERRFEKKAGFRGSQYSGVKGEFDPRTGRKTASPKRKTKRV